MSAMVGARWRPVTATVKGIGSARRTRLHRSLGAVDDTYVRLLSALEAAASDASRERRARIDGECVCRDQGGRAAPLANGRALAHRGERERRQSARGLTEMDGGDNDFRKSVKHDLTHTAIDSPFSSTKPSTIMVPSVHNIGTGHSSRGRDGLILLCFWRAVGPEILQMRVKRTTEKENQKKCTRAAPQSLLQISAAGVPRRDTEGRNAQRP